jgi:hypothetical protein
VGPRDGLNDAKKKKLLHLPGIKLRLLWPANSLGAVLTELNGSTNFLMNIINYCYENGLSKMKAIYNTLGKKKKVKLSL